MKLEIKTLFKIITTPSCWIRNYDTCKIWDARLNGLLDNEDFEMYSGGHTIYFPKSGIRVWVSNFPYCFGDFYGKGRYINQEFHVLPTRTTVFRLHDMLLEKARKEFIREISE